MWSLYVLALVPILLTLTAASTPIFDGFASPGLEYRPKFRYWLPDASADVDAVVRDVGDIAAIGAGGLEFLPYYQIGPQPTNWSEYGFGTEAYRVIFRAVMEAAAKNEILLDFAIGANQAQGVPSDPEEVGLALEMAYVNVTVPVGGSFNGTLPLSTQPSSPVLSQFMYSLEEFGQQNISAVLAVEVLNQPEEPAGTVVVGRIIDLSGDVNPETRSISWTPPPGDAGSTWRLMAWYQRYTNQRSISGGPDARNFVQNGSWIVDHFSAEGAKKMTRFFDEYIIPETQDKEALARVAKYAWEDSMEMNSALWWTQGFAEQFRTSRGYDINDCLPFLIRADTFWSAIGVPYGETFVSPNETLADGCNDDYRIVLQEGYEQYIRAAREWAHGTGAEYSNQPAYNLPLNMLDSVPLLDAPEGESFGFDDNANTYRQFGGPAHMAGISVVSSECGAVSSSGYTQTLQDLLWHIRRGLATGITMNVLHGYGYSGPFVNTTWPGYTVFGYRFTEMWGPRMPAWRHMNDTLAYVGRNQYLSQTGTPKVDLAFYQYAAPYNNVGYDDNNLEQLGFTYDYLGPRSFAADMATVENGILAPSGPAYKGIVFYNQTKLTVEVAEQTKKFAEAGLPIFIVGNPEFHSIGIQGDDAAVNSTMEEVLAMRDNVFVVSEAKELPDALAAAKIRPRALFTSDGVVNWYSFWRNTEEADFVFLYTDGNATKSVNVSFEGVSKGAPYILDAWTGDVAPLLLYSPDGLNVNVPVTLAPNQTTIVAFVNTPDSLAPPPVTFATAIAGSVEALKYTQATSSSSMFAYLSSGPSSIHLSNNKTLYLTGNPPSPLSLPVWNITINDWQSTDDIYSMDTAVKSYSYQNRELAAWKDLDPETLTNTSGIGDYSITFDTPSAGTPQQRLGARVHLGPVKDSIRLWMNGNRLPPVDLTGSPDLVVDITDHLAAAGQSNELRVELASTLYNRLRAEKDTISTSGIPASLSNAEYYTENPPRDYGLLGPAWIEWLEIVEVL
ncbi:hypothetical protein F5Y06DRAFT_263644 [Hypoxylon sp. FL0890]|nr:hypothetical protein F5Y06DRAFT_263644 [Hypoxylon sp. FL0890]